MMPQERAPRQRRHGATLDLNLDVGASIPVAHLKEVGAYGKNTWKE